MELIDDVGAGRVGVDTSVFIYSIEESLVWLPVVRPLFVAADAGVIEIVTSSVTLLEVLVAPYRAKNDAMTKRYEALLTRSRGVNLVELSRQQLRRAAAIRGHYGARTPDALQLAVALDAGCLTFVTNDRRMPDVAGLRVFQLTAYAP